MGKIKKVLAHATLEPRSITPNSVWVDLCENVHIHFRNYRFDMGVEEFAHFMAAMRAIYKPAEYAMEEVKYEEGDPNILKQLLYDVAIPHQSKYYPNRFVIEHNRDDTYHVHYRDFRLHVSKDEFEDMAKAFVNALDKEKTIVNFEEKYGPFNEQKAFTVDIEDVQPYDDGHKPFAPCAGEDHEPGIKLCMEKIKEGNKILPILVDRNGQRLDGFKRYMAFKRLGHKEIEVVWDPAERMGGQHGMPWVMEESCQSS